MSDDLDYVDGNSEPCDYGWSEECVEPALRGGNCFECWLFQQVDRECRKEAE